MVWFVLFIAVVNLGVGFALAVYLGYRESIAEENSLIDSVEPPEPTATEPKVSSVDVLDTLLDETTADQSIQAAQEPLDDLDDVEQLLMEKQETVAVGSSADIAPASHDDSAAESMFDVVEK